MSARQHFAETFAREHATTRRVLHALPASKSEVMPYPGARPARAIAGIFAQGQRGIADAMSGEWQWPPRHWPPPPSSWDEVLESFDATGDAAKSAISAASDARLEVMIPFIAAPQQIHQIPVKELIWFMLLDGVHHRGQLSVYMRAAGEKVPSIYGPTAHEPWM